MLFLSLIAGVNPIEETGQTPPEGDGNEADENSSPPSCKN